MGVIFTSSSTPQMTMILPSSRSAVVGEEMDRRFVCSGHEGKGSSMLRSEVASRSLVGPSGG